MYFAIAHKSFQLGLALTVLVIAFTPAALGQGLMEYGGLMAMPKGLPSGDTIKGLTGGFSRAFGAIPNALPGGQAGQSAAPAIPASIAVVRSDGTVAVDPKKVHDATVKIKLDENQAKQLLARSGATQVELKQAVKDLREAITVRDSIWGYEDVTIAKLLNELGSTYERLKQPAMAKSCYQNAIKYINKKFGFGSSERLDTFVNLAPLLVKEGNLSEALSLQEQIALIKERKSGASDIGAIQARLTWAATAKALDKPNAPDIYKQCLVNLDKAGASISPDKVSKFKGEIIPAYVEALKKQGREDEAKEAATLAVSAAPGPDAPAAAGLTAAGAAPPGAATVTPAQTFSAAAPGTAPSTSTAPLAPTQAAAPGAIPEAPPGKRPASSSSAGATK